MSEKDPRKGKEMQLVSLPPSDHPETLASPNSVAAEVGTSEGRTFSQLLAGAIVSPVGSPRGEDPVAPLSPPFLASPTLLDTQQGFTGQFTMTHQAVLATVTAQAHMHLQTPEASTNSSQQLVLTPTSHASLHQTPGGNSSTPEAEKPPLKSELKTQSAQTVVKTNPNDGYNWRKYGQKQVKSSDRSRSYYKCTNVNCSAKKKVERCPDGKETEITYCGQHNHGLPKRHKSLKERGTQSGGPTRPSRENEALDLPSRKVNRSDPSTKREHISRRETPELLTYCSSDGEEDFAKAEEEHGDEPDPKRRLSESIAPYSAPVLRTVKEPKIIVQSSCDMARISDGYRWRKYGQKIVKGNPNPRSYYRCTHDGCPVRKHVERASDDVKAILITYEGKHNHDQPAQKSDGDQPNTALLIAAAVASVNQDEELQSPNSLDGNSGKSIAGNNAKELGGEKAIESAQTLLSMGFNSSSGETANGTNSDGIKRRPLFNKNHSIVPVQNS